MRNVLVLSTMEQIRGRAVDDKEKPAVIYFYNMTMGKGIFSAPSIFCYFIHSTGMFSVFVTVFSGQPMLWHNSFTFVFKKKNFLHQEELTEWTRLWGTALARQDPGDGPWWSFTTFWTPAGMVKIISTKDELFQ
jgi:hypothetical protein